MIGFGLGFGYFGVIGFRLVRKGFWILGLLVGSELRDWAGKKVFGNWANRRFGFGQCLIILYIIIIII